MYISNKIEKEIIDREYPYLKKYIYFKDEKFKA